MNPSTKDEIKGSFHEVKGEVKKTAGKVTNNPDLQAEGNAEKNTGKIEKSARSKECSKNKLGGLKRSKQLMHRRSPLSAAETGGRQLGSRSSVLKRAEPAHDPNRFVEWSAG